MNLSKKNKIIKFLSAIFFLIASFVHASEFYFVTENKDVSVGQEFKIDLYIDTQKENINAVEGKIIFLNNDIELLKSQIHDSIINFWIDKPADYNESIKFSGITPGGFITDKGKILSLILKTKKEGDLIIGLESVKALKNDGNGTQSKVITSNIVINSSGYEYDYQDLADNIDLTQPEDFKPEISRDQNIYDNKWFIVFATSDKGSGIDRYEIKESRNNIFNFSKWNVAESPYVLFDQELKSIVSVKAIDKSGNERIVDLRARNPMPWYTKVDNWFILLIVALVVFQYLFCKRDNK